MIKRLRKVGNSAALLLDKPILELLGVKERAESTHEQATTSPADRRRKTAS
jgi:antitoxin component of MazEF toxin-antitoxin module